MFSLKALRNFADGFLGGLMGGLAYWLLLTHFYPEGLEFAWLRILAVSLSFGGFEMWRVARNRKRNGEQHGGRGVGPNHSGTFTGSARAPTS